MSEIKEIYERCLKGVATNAEILLFRQWAELEENHEQASKLLEDAFAKSDGLYDMSADSAQLVMESILHVDKNTSNYSQPPIHRIHFLRRGFIRYAAAVIIIFGIGAYLYTTQTKKSVPEKIIAVKDIPAPAANYATITLADGKKISVDEANGLLAKEGTIEIRKNKNGEIVYSGGQTGALQYNTFTVPRGSQVANIVLSDGSKVYLNAASSLKYPVAFSGNERKVEITGEAYFEIAKDANRKFIVLANGVQTTVLGTEFNLNAYPDESFTKVTLVNGRVKVSVGNQGILINPGQQAEASGSNELKKNEHVDLSQVIAWKKGVFVFSNTSLQSMLKQVSRWYNVEVIYEGQIPERIFGGGLGRRSPLSDVVKILRSNGVVCTIEGQKLIIGK